MALMKNGSEVSAIFASNDNPKWYYGMFYFNAFLAVISTGISLFFILTKTPRALGSYKYFLLNISLWAFGFDFYTTIVYQPKILFPAMMMCPKGLLHSRSLFIAYGAFAVILAFYSAGAIAVLSAFGYRYAVMNDLTSKLMKKKVLIPLGIFHVVYMSPTIAFYLLSIGDREAIEKSLIETWPGISKHFHQGEACSALSFHVTKFPYFFLVGCVVQFTAIVPASSFLILKCFTTLNVKRHFMSSKTYKMHKQLLVTLVFQLLVPLVTLILPNTFNACVTLFEIEGLEMQKQKV
ncbi:hypothetical protein FO519_001473 [Halicephalobus sp. NKZ332]|nr:hypothetical protein FO519_001473 [Halicephalobus sp. NKZ332]